MKSKAYRCEKCGRSREPVIPPRRLPPGARVEYLNHDIVNGRLVCRAEKEN